jgi:mono/diheme cytochrome c family protein
MMRVDMAPHRTRTLIVTLLPLVAGCEWFSDFRQQPKVEPWEAHAMVGDTARISARGNPPYSVPIHGSTVPAFRVSLAPMPATVDSMSSLQNPIAPTDSSLAIGRRYFAINCTVCHGDTGMGNGPATRYGMPGISIVTDMTKGRSDGYIWGVIRNGRGLMPSYNRIEEKERWDVVNYVRALQGRLAAPAQVGAVGYPGQTGVALPGATATAPTRPAPFVLPDAGHATSAPVHAPPASPGGAGATPAAQAGTPPGQRSGAGPADTAHHDGGPTR